MRGHLLAVRRHGVRTEGVLMVPGVRQVVQRLQVRVLRRRWVSHGTLHAVQRHRVRVQMRELSRDRGHPLRLVPWVMVHRTLKSH
jgi:hypothetical protein